MVHINCKYYDADGNLDDAYASTEDGVAVLGFLFDVCGANEVSLLSAMITQYIITKTAMSFKYIQNIYVCVSRPFSAFLQDYAPLEVGSIV